MINHPNRRAGYKRLRVVIPDGLAFADLNLCREPNGDVSFDTLVIARIAEASGHDPDVWLTSHEDNVSGLIVQWYAAHKRSGGAIDPVAEDLIAEAKLEGDRGSHKPGRA